MNGSWSQMRYVTVIEAKLKDFLTKTVYFVWLEIV